MRACDQVFIVICPLLRGASLLLLLLRPMTVAAAQRLHARSRAVSYYYALEAQFRRDWAEMCSRSFWVCFGDGRAAPATHRRVRGAPEAWALD